MKRIQALQGPVIRALPAHDLPVMGHVLPYNSTLFSNPVEPESKNVPMVCSDLDSNDCSIKLGV